MKLSGDHYAGPSDQPNSLFMASNCKNLKFEGVMFWASLTMEARVSSTRNH